MVRRGRRERGLRASDLRHVGTPGNKRLGHRVEGRVPVVAARNGMLALRIVRVEIGWQLTKCVGNSGLRGSYTWCCGRTTGALVSRSIGSCLPSLLLGCARGGLSIRSHWAAAGVVPLLRRLRGELRRRRVHGITSIGGHPRHALVRWHVLLTVNRCGWHLRIVDRRLRRHCLNTRRLSILLWYPSLLLRPPTGRVMVP